MSLLKRLEQLERAIRFKEPRIFVITVPTHIGANGSVTADTEVALTALKQKYAVTDEDLVVQIANYTDDPEQAPHLVSVT